MKKFIKAATISGTTWFKLSIDDIKNGSLYRDNAVISHLMNTRTMEELINISHLDGSFIAGGDLYYLESDFRDIEVDGEMVDPLDAGEQFTPDALTAYIEIPEDASIAENLIAEDFNVPRDREQLSGLGIEILKEGVDLTKLAEDVLELGV